MNLHIKNKEGTCSCLTVTTVILTGFFCLSALMFDLYFLRGNQRVPQTIFIYFEFISEWKEWEEDSTQQQFAYRPLYVNAIDHTVFFALMGPVSDLFLTV